MNRIVYKKNDKNSYINASSFCSKNNSLLALIFNYLGQYNLYAEKNEIDGGKIIFWNKYLEEEYLRFRDIPKLVITRQNYDEIVNIWNLNIDNPKQYLVLSQDDSGWIKLETKDVLSVDDLRTIEEDRKAGQAWEEKWKNRANENKMKQFLRSLHDDIRTVAIKAYKQIRAWFEELFEN